MTRADLERQIAALEAKATVKPLGPMAQATLTHARAALAAYGTERDFDPHGRGSKRMRREQGPVGTPRVVSGGLPSLGKRR